MFSFFSLSAMLNSLQQIPQATSPLTSRVIPGASSPGPLDIYTQDPLSYVQATSPQPAGFGGLTLNRVSSFRSDYSVIQHTVIDLITAHAPISAQSTNLVVLVYFYQLLYKSICCVYWFELPRLVEAIQTSTHNICFRKENRKITPHRQH